MLEYGFHRLLCFSNVRFLATILTVVVRRLNRALYFKCLVCNLHHFATKGVSGLKGSSEEDPNYVGDVVPELGWLTFGSSFFGTIFLKLFLARCYQCPIRIAAFCLTSL